MKRIALWCAMSLGAACGPSARVLDNQTPVTFTQIYFDSAGNPITASTADTEQVHRGVGMNKVPMVDPAGNPVTWGKFKEAKGTCEVTCAATETTVKLELTGLLPNATYAMWIGMFDKPGFKSAGLSALLGFSPLGPLDGSKSLAVTDATGKVSYSEKILPGDLTAPAAGKTGTVTACPFDLYEFDIVPQYKMEASPMAIPVPGDPTKTMPQIGFFYTEGKAN
ncbi:MAG: hypothetical protein IPJ65_25975 [Archangiaceae bacterium]|nr:hypothetical protein [Archangiaceae bacterium]